MKTTTFNKRKKTNDEFWKLLIAVSIPIIIQNLIGSSLNMIDTLMIGQVGENEIAAVGIANQIYLLILWGLTGICGGGMIFISQFWGKKDIDRIRKMLGLVLIITIAFSAIITAIVEITPNTIIGFFATDPEVIQLGSDYIKIVAITYIISAFTFSYGFASKGIGQTRMPMIASIWGVGVNVVLNTILIFGMGPIPAMGVVGAAWATVIARLVEASILMGSIYIKKDVLAIGFKHIVGIPKNLITMAWKPIFFVTLSEVMWALGAIMYTAAYGIIGSQAIAAVQISNTVINFLFVIIHGMAIAAAALVGNKIGENKIELAKEYANRIVKICSVVGIAITIFLVLAADPIVNMFAVSDGVKIASKNILYIMGIPIILRVYNSLMTVGILRGGGDTLATFFIEIGTMWLVGIPLAFVAAIYWKLSIEWVAACVLAEWITKFILCQIRFRSGKWIRSVVD